MNVAQLEISLKRSIRRYVHPLLAAYSVVDGDDYAAVSKEMNSSGFFVAIKVGSGPLFPRLDRDISIISMSKDDISNIKMDTVVGILSANIAHLSSIPLYEGDELATQLVVLNPDVGRVIYEIDNYRSKSFSFTVKAAITT